MEPNQGEQTADKPEVADVKAPEAGPQVAAPAAVPVAADAQSSGNGADKVNQQRAATQAKVEGEKKPTAAPVKPATAETKPVSGTPTGMNEGMKSLMAIFIAPLLKMVGLDDAKIKEVMDSLTNKKPAETKPAVAGADKPAVTKPSETKPAETKPTEAKPVVAGADSKPAETKPTSNEPAALVGPPKPAELEPGFVGPIKPDVAVVSPTQDELAGLGATPVAEETQVATKESPALASIQAGADTQAQGNPDLLVALQKNGSLPSGATIDAGLSLTDMPPPTVTAQNNNAMRLG